MRVYLVGGAVRDQLLGLSVNERDWVIVGAHPESIQALGFRSVGKSFPVFLHPETQEEYALARCERKIGPGYGGFEFIASPNISLEQDLQRRDLTINAIAQTALGKIIDPYHGLRDLHDRQLRHVSSAFTEDPLRVLRVARFMARFSELGFTVADETMALMQTIVEQGEMQALTAERVWQELQRALAEPAPWQFFKVLEACGALSILFPSLHDCPQAITALHRACTEPETVIRFAALFAASQIEDVSDFIKRYRISKRWGDYLRLIDRCGSAYQQLDRSSAEDIMALLNDLDAFRQPQRFVEVLKVLQHVYAQDRILTRHLCDLFHVANQVQVKDIIKAGFKGAAIGEALAKRRLERLISELD